MKSIITDLAKEQIRQIAKYIRKEFGKDRRDKIVYRIDGDIIYIVAFWDVRRDPGTLANEVK